MTNKQNPTAMQATINAMQDFPAVVNAMKGGGSRERQRESFAFGNANASNPNVTREMVDKAAEEISPAISTADFVKLHQQQFEPQ